MRKIYILILSLLILISACVFKSSMNIAGSSINPDKIFPDSTNETNRKTSESLKSGEIYPTVWTVVFDLKDFNNLNESLTVWSAENPKHNKLLDETSSKYKTNSGVEIDLLNCAGYLASGKIYIAKNSKPDAESPDWRLKINRETIAKDAEEKIRQCDVPFEIKKDAVPFNQAFAVSPNDNQRRKIKIVGEIDTQKLFGSLPENFQKEAEPSDLRKRHKLSKSLGLFYDNWTDSDGDGKIDLIQLFTEKRAVILFLENDEWKEIAEVGN